MLKLPPFLVLLPQYFTLMVDEIGFHPVRVELEPSIPLLPILGAFVYLVHNLRRWLTELALELAWQSDTLLVDDLPAWWH